MLTGMVSLSEEIEEEEEEDVWVWGDWRAFPRFSLPIIATFGYF